MKKTLLISGIILLLFGIIALVYGSNQSYIDANNVVHDSAWMPIGALMILIGVFSTSISSGLYVIGYIKKRKT